MTTSTPASPLSASRGTTPLLERLFLEERRRTKIVPHAFGERPVPKLMYAAVIPAGRLAKRVQRGLVPADYVCGGYVAGGADFCDARPACRPATSKMPC